jgi:hypothetical protein
MKAVVGRYFSNPSSIKTPKHKIIRNYAASRLPLQLKLLCRTKLPCPPDFREYSLTGSFFREYNAANIEER